MRKHVLTFLLVASLPLVMMAQSGSITEPGSTEPTQLYTTTYDNQDGNSGPNHAPGGPNRIGTPDDFGSGEDGSPVGAPWVLLAFAAAYGAFRLIRRRGVEE